MTEQEGHVGQQPNDDAAASRGGCLKLGWGCLPVWLIAMILPVSLWL